MTSGFSWLNEPGFLKVIEYIYNILKVIRIIVPIALIVVTSLDIAKKVINPDEKEGQKKIMTRAIAAIIVFLIPTLIKLVFSIMDVDIDNLNINNNSSSNTNNNTNNNNNNNSNNKLSSLSITNCLKDVIYQPGARFSLNTNIPSSYKGAITWSSEYEGSVLKFVGAKNETSATFEVVDSPAYVYDAVKVMAGGKINTCYVYVSKPTLSSVNITNCPSTSSRYNPGDKIVLNTDIPSTFKGDIEWKPDYFGHDNFKITPSSDGRSVTLEVIQKPVSTFSTVTVVAGGKATSCLIFVTN